MAEHNIGPSVFRFGDFNADGRSRQLRRGQALVPLQDQPFRVLMALLERPGDVVTRDELRVLLWSGETFVDFEHGLNTAIAKVREALGDSASKPRFIETLPKRGYRFLQPVRAERLEPAACVPQDTVPVVGQERRRGGRAGYFIVIASLGAIALGLVALYRQTLSRPDASSTQHRGVNPQAYDLYLRGKIRAREESELALAAAIDLLERSAALDPGFAPTQAELAHAYGVRVAQFAPGDTEARERARVAAEKALLLAPDLAEAHDAAGQLLWEVGPGRFSAERATREYKKAIALNPSLYNPHHHLGEVYLHVGLLDEAAAELKQALELQPADHNALRRLGIIAVYRGRYDEGLRIFREVPSQSNSSLWHYQVAWALLYLGRIDEASAVIGEYLREHPEDRGGVVTSLRAIWFARTGDAGRAKADIGAAIVKGKGFIHFHHSAYNIASAYALLGDSAASVEWLRVAAETGWPCYPYFAADPNLQSIQANPAYLLFMQGLKAQWDRYRAAL